MSEKAPPSQPKLVRRNAQRSRVFLYVAFTKHRRRCLQHLERADEFERAYMRVTSEPLCVIIMAGNDVLDGSGDVGAGIVEMLDSRTPFDDGAHRFVPHEGIDVGWRERTRQYVSLSMKNRKPQTRRMGRGAETDTRVLTDEYDIILMVSNQSSSLRSQGLIEVAEIHVTTLFVRAQETDILDI
jgi:hypothetical protein